MSPGAVMRQSISRTPTCQSPGGAAAATARCRALAATAAAVAALAALPASAASPDGLDSAAAAALLAATRAPAAGPVPSGGPGAAAGALVSGTTAALPLSFALAHLGLGVPTFDVEAGLLRAAWLHRTVQFYGGASAFVSPRHGFAAGGRAVAGAAWQASWPDTLVRLGGAVSAGAAAGVDQGWVPLIPGELSIEVARGTRLGWLFARLSAGAEVAAAQRWTARGAFQVGVLLGR